MIVTCGRLGERSVVLTIRTLCSRFRRTSYGDGVAHAEGICSESGANNVLKGALFKFPEEKLTFFRLNV